MKPWLKNYPKGVTHEIQMDPYQSAMDIFDEAIRNFRQKTAFSNMGGKLTFEDLDREVGNFASFLQNELKLKKGDEVVVIAGKDRGKKGSILRVIVSQARVVVSGVGRVKRHTKPSAISAGGIIEKEMPIHISNVALSDPKTGKPSRIGFKVLNDGKKVRIAKRSGEQVGGR